MFQTGHGAKPAEILPPDAAEKARQRVLYSTDTITEITQSVGFASSTPMARHYAEAFGVNPNDERRRLVGLRGLGGAMPPND